MFRTVFRTVVHLAKLWPALYPGNFAEKLAAVILKQAEGAETDQHKAALKRVLRALDARYPAESDAAVNHHLAAARAAKKDRAKKGATDEEAEVLAVDEVSAAAKEERVLEVLQGGLSGSIHAPLVENNSSLWVALESPAVQMRLLVCLSIIHFLCQE